VGVGVGVGRAGVGVGVGVGVGAILSPASGVGSGVGITLGSPSTEKNAKFTSVKLINIRIKPATILRIAVFSLFFNRFAQVFIGSQFEIALILNKLFVFAP
jgi:hypothetical protein